MERGLIMLVHSAIIALILYGVMVFLLKQRPSVAEDRSVLFGGLVLVYMVLFGHGMPSRINRNLVQ